VPGAVVRLKERKEHSYRCPVCDLVKGRQAFPPTPMDNWPACKQCKSEAATTQRRRDRGQRITRQ
jgi:hypothetical protein